ncbi:MAG: HigA family addiction module antitoxin [Rhabdochlamydiaceae bacterium]|jgi:addiction module HigA family antidote
MLPKRRKPTHPGVILMEEFLKPLGMTSRQFAEKLGENWNEYKIEAIINEKEGLPDKACAEFAAALGTTPQFWQHLQNSIHQWEQTHKHNEKGSLKPWKKAQ